MFFLYIPHENNVYYNLFDKNIFEELEYDVVNYSYFGLIGLIGDWNSLVGTYLDYIESDELSHQLHGTQCI